MGSPEPCLEQPWFLGFPDVGWWDSAGVRSCRSRWEIVQVARKSTFNFKTKNPLQAARTVHARLGREVAARSWEASGGPVLPPGPPLLAAVSSHPPKGRDGGEVQRARGIRRGRCCVSTRIEIGKSFI